MTLMAKDTVPPEVSEFFRKAGSLGGKQRRKNLSARRRSQIARKASRARWGRKR